MFDHSIEIHEITSRAVYKHIIKIPELKKLSSTVKNINKLLELCRQFVNGIRECNRTYVYATAYHKETFLRPPAVIEHDSPEEFYKFIWFDPNKPVISKIINSR